MPHAEIRIVEQLFESRQQGRGYLQTFHQPHRVPSHFRRLVLQAMQDSGLHQSVEGCQDTECLHAHLRQFRDR